MHVSLVKTPTDGGLCTFPIFRMTMNARNNKRTILIFGIFLFPHLGFAHGEDVLLPVFIQLGSIFIFLIWLTSTKLRIANKLILLASYFLSIGVIILLTWNLPYRQNKALTDMLWVLGPAFLSFLTYLILKRRKSM
jgi:D-alanyl-lipoteichoic acid acyltransferase DltB (MBOAT superfamily)